MRFGMNSSLRNYNPDEARSVTSALGDRSSMAMNARKLQAMVNAAKSLKHAKVESTWCKDTLFE